jgi:hypothetical protein
MKKVPVALLLIPLVLFEVYLCTIFMPIGWQHAIDRRIPTIFPETSSHQTSVTHPNLDREVEQVLQDHIWLQFVLYSFTVILLVANGLVIRKLWRFAASS